MRHVGLSSRLRHDARRKCGDAQSCAIEELIRDKEIEAGRSSLSEPLADRNNSPRAEQLHRE